LIAVLNFTDKPECSIKNLTIKFSRNVAVVFGISMPFLETIRRWHKLGNLSKLPIWLDNYIQCF